MDRYPVDLFSRRMFRDDAHIDEYNKMRAQYRAEQRREHVKRFTVFAIAGFILGLVLYANLFVHVLFV